MNTEKSWANKWTIRRCPWAKTNTATLGEGRLCVPSSAAHREMPITQSGQHTLAQRVLEDLPEPTQLLGPHEYNQHGCYCAAWDAQIPLKTSLYWLQHRELSSGFQQKLPAAVEPDTRSTAGFRSSWDCSSVWILNKTPHASAGTSEKLGTESEGPEPDASVSWSPQ